MILKTYVILDLHNVKFQKFKAFGYYHALLIKKAYQRKNGTSFVIMAAIND